MPDKVAVEISRELYEKAKKFIEEQGGFQSVEELVEFLLQEALAAQEAAAEAGVSEEDEEKVKERLRALGYI